MTDGMLSQTEGEASGAGMRCGWRQWAAMWATVLVGMALSLLLTGRSALVLTPYSPLVLTLGSGALMGLSAICVWGLLFLVPLGCVFHAWVEGRGSWWRLLPVAALLMALLATFGLTLMGIRLPMAEGASGLGGLFEAPQEPSQAELDAAYTVTLEAWRVCWRACGVLTVLLLLQVTVVCGWRRSWAGIREYATRLCAHSRELRERSRREEEEREAARAKAAEASGAGSVG